MISVGLPVFNQSRILPLALHGLANQMTGVGWELIICSEDGDVFDIVWQQRERLRKANCSRIKTLPLYGWIPLPMKWKMIGEHLDPESCGMILQAADCYPPQYRIQKSYDAMISGHNWYQERRGFFYDIRTKTMVEYQGEKNRTGLNMCISAEHARILPESKLTRNIDGWIFGTIKDPAVQTMESNMGGVDFNGLNNISLHRGEMITDLVHPFYSTGVQIHHLLPADALQILEGL